MGFYENYHPTSWAQQSMLQGYSESGNSYITSINTLSNSIVNSDTYKRIKENEDKLDRKKKVKLLI